MGIIRYSSATSLKAPGSNSDPLEFNHKMQTQFGNFPILLTNVNIAAVTTLKNAAVTPGPFLEVLNELNAGFSVVVDTPVL